jgi:hypothetical protein
VYKSENQKFEIQNNIQPFLEFPLPFCEHWEFQNDLSGSKILFEDRIIANKLQIESQTPKVLELFKYSCCFLPSKTLISKEVSDINSIGTVRMCLLFGHSLDFFHLHGE